MYIGSELELNYRLFHMVGPVTEKARSPSFVLVLTIIL